MMTFLLIIVSVFIPFSLFLWEKNESSSRSFPLILSHFWVFTLFWFLSFPFKAILIEYLDIPLQGTKVYSVSSFQCAIFFSIVVWVFVWIGRRKTVLDYIDRAHFSNNIVISHFSSFFKFRMWFFLLVSFVLLFFFLQSVGLSNLLGTSEQNAARVGNGVFFLSSSMYQHFVLILLVFYFLFNYSIKDNIYKIKHFTKRFYLFFSGILILGCVMTVVMASRRYLSFLILLFALLFALREIKHSKLLSFVILFGFVIGAPLLQAFRYLVFSGVDWQFVFVSLGSTYEGIDHLAVYFEDISWRKLLIGVDSGVSWWFNSFLSLVPRFFWESKPFLYGSIAIQEYFYPWMYDKTNTPSTYPMSFIVDFLFGMGVFIVPFMCLLWGKLLGYCELIFRKRHVSFVFMLFSVKFYLILFNFVRGGTAIIMDFVLTFAIYSLVIGFFRIGVLIKDLFLFMFYPDKTHIYFLTQK